uniref:Carbonic anhydrase n=1 Tax=Dunaliella salina TaxID=3046 RepID=CAH_DUNSA|nr:RecName: Full=Carbonic anhydrase; AltName: Full=Carbonate dehydratase [Dunaliella salina]
MGSRRITLLGALFAVLAVAIEGRTLLTHNLKAEAAETVDAVSSVVAGSAGRQLLVSEPHDYNYEKVGFDWTGGVCVNTGTSKQSPINIETDSLAEESERLGTADDTSRLALKGLLSSSYQLTSEVAINLEQDMQFSFNAPDEDLPQLTIGGVVHTFKPVQIHFHHFASEHAIDGQLYPLEAHMVMASQNDGSDQLAVIGIMYKYGEEDPFLKRLQETAQSNGEAGDKNVELNSFSINVARDLLPESDLTYYGYDGSLTTPGCDERVKWHVFKEARTVSVAQLKVFSEVTLAAHPEATVTNNRVIQPLNGRKVYEYKGEPNDKYNYVQHGFDWRDNGLDSCAGDVQSPIDIVTSTLQAGSSRSDVSSVNLMTLNTDAFTLTGNTVNIGQGMQINFGDPPAGDLPVIRIGTRDVTFRPLQVHWHFFLSEHTVDGVHYPLEAHIVMKDNDNLGDSAGQLAVIGIMYKYGDADPFITDMQKRVSDKIASGAITYGQSGVSLNNPDDPFNVNIKNNFLPSELGYAGYDGSLTTPPCSEIVKWHVFLEPRTVSVEQMEVFADVTLNSNPGATVTTNRMIQPLEGRTVYGYNGAAA